MKAKTINIPIIDRIINEYCANAISDHIYRHEITPEWILDDFITSSASMIKQHIPIGKCAQDLEMTLSTLFSRSSMAQGFDLGALYGMLEFYNALKE